MRDGKTLTFVELFGEVENVEIPIIQRDYAQGRAQAIDIRILFLESIKNILLTDEEMLEEPLDMDFVYGSFEGSEQDVFSLLDGQQRLTTLFLLHWYLSIVCDAHDHFSTYFIRDNKSRFTYKTRQSAIEFFNALVNSGVSKDALNNVKSVSALLTNCQWFFIAWKQDPTIESCLIMLDEMHGMFQGCSSKIYERLINSEKPYVTFQYLNLKSFGLSDELYIKMNARGKALTPFENFKAWLFGQLDELADEADFELKVDQQWTDIFWKMSAQSESKEFDQIYLSFFNLMAFYSSCEQVEGSFAGLDDNTKKWLREIRGASGYISPRKFEKYNCFNLKCLESIVSVLDFICHTPSHSDVFEAAVQSTDYITQIRFFALIKFLVHAPIISDWTEETHLQLSRWIRVTNNLIYNDRIDEYASFIPAVRALSTLAEYSLDIYGYLVRTEPAISGFNSEQWDEECLKAILISENVQWESLFISYESHSYLIGQLGFILDMSEEDGKYSIGQFKECADKVSVLFNEEILESNEFLLQRALLSIDDYLLRDGYSSRYSFAVSKRGTYRERAANWLAVARKPCFQKLVSQLDVRDVKGSLKSIICNSQCNDWRQFIVNNPAIIRYCGSEKRFIHRDLNTVYLLTKSTLRAYHAELQTYALYQRLDNASLPEGVRLYPYDAVYGDEDPGIKFSFSGDKVIRLIFKNGGFVAFERESLSRDSYGSYSNKQIDMPDEILKILHEQNLV